MRNVKLTDTNSIFPCTTCGCYMGSAAVIFTSNTVKVCAVCLLAAVQLMTDLPDDQKCCVCDTPQLRNNYTKCDACGLTRRDLA